MAKYQRKGVNLPTLNGSFIQKVQAPTGVAATDRQAILDAITAVTTLGGEVRLQPGVYLTDQTITVPGGVTVVGTGLDYSTTQVAAGRASVICAGPSLTTIVVQLGSDSTSTASGQTAPALRSLIVDGAKVAGRAVKTVARRTRITDCQIYRGTVQTLDLSGQNSNVKHCVIGADSQGSTVAVNADDCKIMSNEIREGGTEQLLLVSGNNTQIIGNHLYGVSLSGANRADIRFSNTSEMRQVLIANNTLEATAGPIIDIAGSVEVAGVDIVGNTIFQANVADGAYPVILFSGPVWRGSVVGNTATWAHSGTGLRWSYFISRPNGTSANAIVMVGNQVHDTLVMFNSFTPRILGHNVLNNTVATLLSHNGGRIAFNGTGSQTAFTIPHGLWGTPTAISVNAGTAAASGAFSVIADGTNITVTYVAAPASGTSNVVLAWTASMQSV